jgi:hypothetical protein
MDVLKSSFDCTEVLPIEKDVAEAFSQDDM